MAPKKLSKEVIIILLVIAAALVYLLVQNTDHTQYDLPRLEPIDQKGLTRLLIEKPDETLEFENREGSWVLAPEGYATDKEKVQKALDLISSLKLAELISRSGNEALYDLTPDKRIAVSIFKGSDLVRKIDCGKVATSYRHTFVRLKDSAEVYQAQGSLRTELDLKRDDWRDKQVFTYDANAVTGLRISSGDQAFDFKKTVTKTEAAQNAEASAAGPVVPQEAVSWVSAVERKEAVKKDAIEAVMSKLQDLRCDRYAPKETVPGPVMLELTLQAATPQVLTLYKPESEEATEILAGSSQTPHLFYLSKWSADALKKGESDLFEMPQTSPETKQP
jgi:hypothetical protein